MNKDTCIEINQKLDALLQDHQVDFDDSNMKLDSLETMHKKVNALLEAHNSKILDGDNSVASLQPKLDKLIEAHGAEFDETDSYPNSLHTVMEKLTVLLHEHGKSAT